MRRLTNPLHAVTLALGALAAPAAMAQAGNLVVNGDFSAGNTGFDSGYVYVAPAYDGGDGPAHGGLYTVVAAANLGSATSWGGGWSVPDLASNVLLVNGASTDYAGVTAPLSSLWSEAVTVRPDTDYLFSFIGVAVDGQPDAALQPSIDGVLGATLTTTWGQWQQGTMTWNSGTNTLATLSLVDLDTNEGNNDFAVTGISLTASTVPEPASPGLLLAGLGAIGLVAGRLRPRS